MTEAARACIQWAFGQPGIYRVYATVDVDNIPSQRVLEKAGTQQKAFNVLLEVLKELDKGGKPVYHSYRSVNSKLIERKINFNDLGFNQFKEFIQAAESRGIVDSKVEGLKHSVKRL